MSARPTDKAPFGAPECSGRRRFFERCHATVSGTTGRVCEDCRQPLFAEEPGPVCPLCRLKQALARSFRASLLLLASAGSLTACREARAVQPIAFNHRIHTVKNELACDTCHEQVYEARRAGLPQAELCMGCHDGGVEVRPEAAPQIAVLKQHAEEKTPLPWVRLHTLPAHVYYSHRRHTKIAGLECATCHDDIGTSERPPSGPVARTLNMSTCMDCHHKRGVENDCAWCHR